MIDRLIAEVWHLWRDEKFTDLCDEMRDADLTAEEMDLSDRFNINFYDDVMDPLLPLIELRKGNILHEVLDRQEAALPLEEMHRLAESYLATPAGHSFAQYLPKNEIARAARDIRTIRAA